MFSEMTTTLDNLFSVPKEYLSYVDHENNGDYNVFITLATTQIDLDYLILRVVNSNIKFLDTIKEHFEGEVKYCDQFVHTGKKVDMFLYDILSQEALSPEPSSKNVIDLLKRDYIVIRKDEEYDEMWKTLDLMKSLTGEGRRKSLFRMKLFPLWKGKQKNYFKFKNDLLNLLGEEESNIELKRLTLYKDIVNLGAKYVEKLDFDDLMAATSFDGKEVARLLRKKRKEIKIAISQDILLSNFQYNLNNDFDLYVISEWRDEMIANNRHYFYDRFYRSELKINRLKIYPNSREDEPDTLALIPSFKSISSNELFEILLKIVKEKKVKVA